jgi:hypothetical protein
LKGRIGTLAAAFVLLALAVGAEAGSLPVPLWEGSGAVEWESGYILSYGRGNASSNSANSSVRRAGNLKAAARQARRNMYRLCLGLTVQDGLTVRDYLRQDPELQGIIRKKLLALPPWEIRIGKDEEAQLVLKLPMGGRGGLSELLGDLGSAGEEVYREGGGFDPGPVSLETGSATGVVLIASRHSVIAALRPRIVGGSGRILLEHGEAAAEAHDRPAYIAYYGSLEDAMRDPVVGENPLVVAAGEHPERGSDLVLPQLLEESLSRDDGARRILAEARFSVVLQ